MISPSALSRTVRILTSTFRNMSRKTHVYIYDGEGAAEESKTHVYQSLVENLSSRHKVTFITPDAILKGKWTDDAAMMVFGGGFDRGFLRTLGQDGVQLIRSYVLEGGKYFGICAGGYFGCDYIEFDKDGPLEVCGPRHLEFFPGCGRGPVYPGFRYNSLLGSRAAPIDFTSDSADTNSEVKTFFHGGCCFDLDQSKFTRMDSSNRLEVIGDHLKTSRQYSGHDGNMGQVHTTVSDRPKGRSHDMTDFNVSNSTDSDVLKPNIKHSNSRSYREVLEPVRDSGHNTIVREDTDHNTSVREDTDHNTSVCEDSDNNTSVGKETDHNTSVREDPDHNTSVREVEILSRYTDLPSSPPAIVKTRVGRGVAILSGVHIEFIPAMILKKEPKLQDLVKELEQTDQQRLDCFRYLLLQLELELSPKL